jgi:aspartate kinase
MGRARTGSRRSREKSTTEPLVFTEKPTASRFGSHIASLERQNDVIDTPSPMHSKPKFGQAGHFGKLGFPTSQHAPLRKSFRAPAHQPLHVLKFGGTSVGDAGRINNIAKIIADAAQETSLVVVVSAMAGVTNKLMSAATHAESRNSAQIAAIFQELCLQHELAADALIPDSAARRQLGQRMRTLFHEGEYLCQAAVLIGDVTPQVRDSLASLGERLSAPLVAAALTALGLPSESISAAELIVTDANYGAAQPCLDTTRQRSEARLRPLLREGILPIVTGFIGATPEGTLTTLGRGGSDYSATILGAALDADEVIIWTDVDGVLTADPRLVPEACTLPEISYREAADLARFGAKVLHPRTLQPVMQSEIPIWIRNSFAPQHPGTRISPSGSTIHGEVKAVTAIHEAQMIGLYGTSAAELRDASTRARAAMSTFPCDAFTTADRQKNDLVIAVRAAIAEQAAHALRIEFSKELAQGGLNRVTPGPLVAIVTLVGHDLHNLAQIGERSAAALRRAQVELLAIGTESSGCNLSLLVPPPAANKALAVLHEEFQLTTSVSEPIPVRTLS